MPPSAGTIAAAAALLGGGDQAPQERPARSPGDSYWTCRIEHIFTVPGRGGGPALMAKREGNRIQVLPWPTPVQEKVYASMEVERDGRTSALNLSWVQTGNLGFPYLWRQDLGAIGMTGTFERPGLAPAAPSFDPAGVSIQIDVKSERKLKGAMVFRLWRDGEKKWLGLGGEARIPPWRQSAQVILRWPVLSAFAAGDRELNYEFAEPAVFPYDKQPAVLRAGRLDLSIMPGILEGFAAAEADLLAAAADRTHRCTEQVADYDSSIDSIAVTPTGTGAVRR